MNMVRKKKVRLKDFRLKTQTLTRNHTRFKQRVNITYTVGYVTTNDVTTKEFYNEKFLSIKARCYNEHRCCNERGAILTVDVARACA